MTLSILNLGSPENEASLRRIVTEDEEAPYIRTLRDASQARSWIGLYRPDLLVIDARHVHNYADFIARLRVDPTCNDMPILAIAPGGGEPVLYAGAVEVVPAPLEPLVCRSRLLALLDANDKRRTRRHRGRWADGRVGKIARRIAESLGLHESECELIESGAAMIDIGEIGIPDAILHKPGPLTAEERQVMQSHARIGHDILKNGRSADMRYGAVMALAHHERVDGGGYPNGIRGEEIPLCARIVAVADVYDALSSRRPYRLRWTTAKVLDYLAREKGRHFDPYCVDALLSPAKSAADIQ